jgi:hypothetical protein
MNPFTVKENVNFNKYSATVVTTPYFNRLQVHLQAKNIPLFELRKYYGND